MLTKYITAVKTSFSPFNATSGKTARNFLALIPPSARSTIALDVEMLGRAHAAKPATLSVKFKDGKEINLDLQKLKIRDVQAELDRHSRLLRRADELSGN